EQAVTLAASDVSVIAATIAGADKPVEKAGGLGKVKLNLATDGATVYVDGAQLEDGSWKESIPLRAGSAHEFKISKKGFKDSKFSVTLAANEEQSRDVHLDPATGH